MKKRIVPIMLALLLMLCLGMLCITPAAFAVIYGPEFGLPVNGIGTLTGVTGIYSLTYGKNHMVYGVASTSSTPYPLFSVALDSSYYPLTATAVTATTAMVPPSGFIYTTIDGSTTLGGDALTAGYIPTAATHDLAIYGGGTEQLVGPCLIIYDIDTASFSTYLLPSTWPSWSLRGSVFALTTGIDGEIYGGTGNWPLPVAPAFADFFVYDPVSRLSTFIYQVTSPADRFIDQLATGMHGEIYFLSQPSGTLWVYEPQTHLTSQVGTAGMGYTALTVDESGNVWLCTSGDNLYEYTPPVTPKLWGPIVSPPSPSILTIYGMAAGTHGDIYMAASDGTNGYLLQFDLRCITLSGVPYNPGPLGAGSAGYNPGTIVPTTLPSPLANTPAYSLVECNEQGTIFGGTGLGSVTFPSQLFYCYEGGSGPDILNYGVVNILPIAFAATQWLFVDPPAKATSSTTNATVPAFVVILGVAALAVILGVQKRQKKKT